MTRTPCPEWQDLLSWPFLCPAVNELLHSDQWLIWGLWLIRFWAPRRLGADGRTKVCTRATRSSRPINLMRLLSSRWDFQPLNIPLAVSALQLTILSSDMGSGFPEGWLKGFLSGFPFSVFLSTGTNSCPGHRVNCEGLSCLFQTVWTSTPEVVC